MKLKKLCIVSCTIIFVSVVSGCDSREVKEYYQDQDRLLQQVNLGMSISKTQEILRNLFPDEPLPQPSRAIKSDIERHCSKLGQCIPENLPKLMSFNENALSVDEVFVVHQLNIERMSGWPHRTTEFVYDSQGTLIGIIKVDGARN